MSQPTTIPDVEKTSVPKRAEVTGKNLPSLTAIRFIAALMIFSIHVAPVHWFTYAGRTGVSFFFVLSGFVLTWSSRDGERLGNFYRRRVARIIPAYLAIWVLRVALLFVHNPDNARVLDTAPGFVLLQSWFPSDSVYFAANGAAWSVSTETFFYLAFPFLLAAMQRLQTRGLITVFALALLASPAVHAVVLGLDGQSFWTDIFPPSRIPEFVCGIAIGLAYRRGFRLRFPVSIAAVITVGGYLLANVVPGWATPTTYLVPAWCLLIASCAASDLRGRFTPLQFRPLWHLGVWSYSFYLVHQTVILGLGFVIGGHHGIGFVALALLTSVVASYALFALVERRGERLIRPRHRLPTFEIPAGRSSATNSPAS